MHASIGEMVDSSYIAEMVDFIEKHGEEVFNKAVYHHAFGEVVYAYLHPCDEMKSTPYFDVIQKAFIRAYV
jgi:hypothetical protein